MLTSGVVIDVYGEFVFKSGNSRAFHIRAFDHKNRVVNAVHLSQIAYFVRTGQTAIRRGNITANYHLGIFAQRSQEPAKPKGRTNAVAIRLDVGGYREAALIFN